MAVIKITVHDSASDALQKLAPDARAALKAALQPVTRQLTQDVRANALRHIRFEGAKPGLYLASIYGGVADKDHRVLGYVRSDSPLAHLLENGFTISDILIAVKNARSVMAFWVDVGTLYRQVVHRHETRVQAYPAFKPALEARRDEIGRILKTAVEEAGLKAMKS